MKLSCLFCCEKIFICSFLVFICFQQRAQYKPLISGFMWQVAPEFRIQLFSFKLSPKYVLEISTLEYIHAIDLCILCDSLWYLLFSHFLSNFVDLYKQCLSFLVFQWIFFSEASSFGQFATKLSSDSHLKHIFCFRPLHLLQIWLELHGLKSGFLWPFSIIGWLKNFSVGCEPP